MVSIGSKVFVPTVGREDKEPFVLATVLTSAPKLTVKLPDGSELSPDPSSISIANQNTEADNTALVNLSDATLLAATLRDHTSLAPAAINLNANPLHGEGVVAIARLRLSPGPDLSPAPRRRRGLQPQLRTSQLRAPAHPCTGPCCSNPTPRFSAQIT